MKSIVYIILSLFMANSYAQVGILVEESKLELNECGETYEDEHSSDTICVSLNHPKCESGTVARSTIQGIVCDGVDVEQFLEYHELAEY